MGLIADPDRSILTKVNEQLEFLRLIVGRLDSAGIPYMLTGATAMAVYTEPRMTRDLDLVIECRPEAAGHLSQLLSAECYVDTLSIREALQKRSTFHAIHQQWLIKADFIVRKDTAYRKCEFERRKLLRVDGMSVWVVSAEDLILSKLVWAQESESALQLQDIRLLLRSTQGLDWPYLEKWAHELDVQAVLNQARPT